MKKTNTPLEKLVNLFYEVGTLRKTARSHRQCLLTDDLSDNIASHSFRVAIIGLFLAKQAKLDHHKVLEMCLLHDIGESRSGDQNWIHKRYVKVFEDENTKDQLSGLLLEKEIRELDLEYHDRKSKEALIAKDADILDQILLLKEYSWIGNQEAATWLKHNNHLKLLKTTIAKKVAREILKQRPSDWWYLGLWTPNRR